MISSDIVMLFVDCAQMLTGGEQRLRACVTSVWACQIVIFPATLQLE